MIMLISDDNKISDLLSKKREVKVCSDDAQIDPNEVLCFHFTEICRKDIEMIQSTYSESKLIFIIERNIAFHFFNFIKPSNVSYILASELKSQFEACYLSVVSGGIYISKYFKDVLIIKQSSDSLTDREVDVVELLKEGCDYKDIAKITHLQYGTVRNYVSRILEITELENKTKLAVHFQKILRDKSFKY